MYRFAAFMAAGAVLTACGGPAEQPVPADPQDPASIVAAARQCDLADFDGVRQAEPDAPELSGEIDPAEANALRSALFIEQMAQQPCVYGLPSGLHLRIIRPVEDGPTPRPGQLVSTHYEGWLPDGEMFDSSRARGEPFCASTNILIPGLTEALGLMREGEEWEVYLPPELAYGETGFAPRIAPGQALKYRLELLDLPLACPA